MANLVKAVRREGLSAGKRPKIKRQPVGVRAEAAHAVPVGESDRRTRNRLPARPGAQSLNIQGVTIKWSPPFMSLLEGVFARGDERLADVLEKAVANGAEFDAWARRSIATRGARPSTSAVSTRRLSPRGRYRSVKNCRGITFTSASRKSGSSRKRKKRWSERRRSVCENAPCPERCGACDDKAQSVFADVPRFEEPVPEPRPQRENYRRLRVVYEKTGPASWLGHLDTMRSIPADVATGGVENSLHRGFSSQAEDEFRPCAVVGIESECEAFDAWALKDHSLEEVVSAFNANAPTDEGEVGGRVDRQGSGDRTIDGKRKNIVLCLQFTDDAKVEINSSENPLRRGG